MNDQHPLALHHGDLTFSRHGLLIHGDLDRDQWRHLLGSLQSVKHAYHCALADIINYGRGKFGEEAIAADLEQLEFDMADTTKAIAIGSLDLAFRLRNPLTSEHYYILAGLPDESSRTRWATAAVAEKLSALELKRSIEAGRVVRTALIQDSSGQNTGITTIQGVVFQFKQWDRKVGGREGILKLPEKDRRDLLGHLHSFVELADAIQQSLPES